MFSFLKRKQKADRSLGVCFHPQGISLALAARNSRNEIILEHLDFRATADNESIPSELKKMISEAGLKNLPTVFVLDADDYSLLQVEAPEVSAEELKNAVRWRIKDLIDFHIDDAVIELIELPQSKRVGSPKLMYVIAARSSFIESLIEQLTAAGLDLKAIDVTELALRNMTFADAQENRASALLYLSKDNSLIEICSNGSLCLSRHIALDTSRVDFDSAQSRMEMMDMLSLEVQRSLDYYESQFANGAASKLNFVAPGDDMIREFKEVAGSYLTVPVESLAALQAVKGIETFDQQLVAKCLPTIGGAIRDFAWTG